jgi:hypothetical protein
MTKLKLNLKDLKLTGAVVLTLATGTTPQTASSLDIKFEGGYPCNAGFINETGAPDSKKLNNGLNYSLTTPSTTVPVYTPPYLHWKLSTDASPVVLSSYQNILMPSPQSPTDNAIKNIFPFEFHLASEDTGQKFFVDVCVKGDTLLPGQQDPGTPITVNVTSTQLISGFGDYLTLALPQLSASIVAHNCGQPTPPLINSSGTTNCRIDPISGFPLPHTFSPQALATKFNLVKPVANDIVFRLTFAERDALGGSPIARNWEPDAATFNVFFDIPEPPAPLLQFLGLKITQSLEDPLYPCTAINISPTEVEILNNDIDNVTLVSELASRYIRIWDTTDKKQKAESIFGEYKYKNVYIELIPNPSNTYRYGRIYWKIPIDLNPDHDVYFVFEEDNPVDRGCFEDPGNSKYGFWGRFYRKNSLGTWGSCRIALKRSNAGFECPYPSQPIRTTPPTTPLPPPPAPIPWPEPTPTYVKW